MMDLATLINELQGLSLELREESTRCPGLGDEVAIAANEAMMSKAGTVADELDRLIARYTA